MNPSLTESHAGTLSPDEKDNRAAGQLLQALDAIDYEFIAPTPASHARVLAREGRAIGSNLIDLLGWSLPCRSDDLPEAVIAALEEAEFLERYQCGLIAARIRVSRVFGNLFIHSRFPTTQHEAVFLGPDSHRFADYILRNIDGLPGNPRILDYGAGAGAGGITAATRLPGARLTMADFNPNALALAAANASHARVAYDLAQAHSPADLDRNYDLVVMHPPFMIDPDRRAYRDGGDLFGGRISLDWAREGAGLLTSGGRLVMHTGVSIVAGRDVLRDALADALPTSEYVIDYHLLDPDIFGDELSNAAYAEVDRIAAVGLRIDRLS